MINQLYGLCTLKGVFTEGRLLAAGFSRGAVGRAVTMRILEAIPGNRYRPTSRASRLMEELEKDLNPGEPVFRYDHGAIKKLQVVKDDHGRVSTVDPDKVGDGVKEEDRDKLVTKKDVEQIADTIGESELRESWHSYLSEQSRAGFPNSLSFDEWKAEVRMLNESEESHSENYWTCTKCGAEVDSIHAKNHKEHCSMETGLKEGRFSADSLNRNSEVDPRPGEPGYTREPYTPPAVKSRPSMTGGKEPPFSHGQMIDILLSSNVMNRRNIRPEHEDYSAFDVIEDASEEAGRDRPDTNDMTRAVAAWRQAKAKS